MVPADLDGSVRRAIRFFVFRLVLMTLAASCVFQSSGVLFAVQKDFWLLKKGGRWR